ncbi:bifunctional biotin--[acetyl-CoA-carboxylase] synthetase/biotin operon repressor [Halobacillus halophilus]|uniref:Bifunctional ligase/repressor BirA n=1 Tax=Halobacillus halophilus (strain ATCC 35676 / DSM 2266 / JCM 20832 / KCTC 3685 / LMG 17431 / NBRC 102448 / NCIMB 2269) TaxID=866895 RepID=I0JN83_HALH3|nr:biotin--[acetyl-CoA-carboxylase] ligase [Halobacillus halophilus]ASF39666.1 bifunctional biotin--[acetyl-CoA-carboxylase] synthetase/biotin operon repressor [Halobacillus halophilus]CCG45603.1 biotin [acetyl-CoA carboxylase] ligase [Halobacillus halophilus DSM 2266]
MESTRKQLIDLLEKEKGYVSGQQLSDSLNISRTAVWKHMNELKKDGYQIEAVRKKGYKILSSPDKISGNTLQWGLETKWLGQKLIHFDQVESTQEIGHQLASQGKPHGTVVIADAQGKGRGRMARNWHSPKGKGIWMSILLRPDLPPMRAPQLTLLAATVLAKMVREKTNLHPQIKWPNDLLIDHKKVSGILTEMQAEHDQIQYVVLGIGMNVNQQLNEIPQDIRHKASSLKIESGQEWDIQQTIQSILRLFENTYDSYVEQGFEQVKKEWEHFGYRIGEEVTISTMRREWQATLIGIEPDGALRARDKDGNEEKLYSAEIHWGEGGYHA